MTTGARVLLANGFAQFLVASLLGWLMLVPMQPWGRKWRKALDPKSLLAAHLDWIMLGLTQIAAAAALTMAGVAPSPLLTALLIAGGWLNATPYLMRGKGINAFELAGPTKQRIAASISGLSSLCLTVGYALVLFALV